MEVTLNVCQGIGDTFWVYQKLAPYVNGIHFRIAHVRHVSHKLMSRAEGFIRMWPKTLSVTSFMTTHEAYNMLSQGQFYVPRVLQNLGPSWYACNSHLEQGVRLEDIDPHYPPQETVPLQLEPIHVPPRYIAVYVSGTTDDGPLATKMGTWSEVQWVEFLERIHSSVPFLFLGASYDQPILERLARRFGSEVEIDRKPTQVLYMLKHCDFFVGYQSGLNVLADNLDVRQLMLYFPYLQPMLYTWCKRQNAGTVFHADTFAVTPQRASEYVSSWR